MSWQCSEVCLTSLSAISGLSDPEMLTALLLSAPPWDSQQAEVDIRQRQTTQTLDTGPEPLLSFIIWIFGMEILGMPSCSGGHCVMSPSLWCCLSVTGDTSSGQPQETENTRTERGSFESPRTQSGLRSPPTVCPPWLSWLLITDTISVNQRDCQHQ